MKNKLAVWAVAVLIGLPLGGWAKSGSGKTINTSYRIGIEFPPGSAAVDAKYYNDISNVTHILDMYPYAKCEIKGYTDNVGSEAVNLRISAARAESVRQVMISKYHISPERITTNGFGPADPVASNKTEEGRRLNRRIVAVIKGQPVGSF